MTSATPAPAAAGAMLTTGQAAAAARPQLTTMLKTQATKTPAWRSSQSVPLYLTSCERVVPIKMTAECQRRGYEPGDTRVAGVNSFGGQEIQNL